MKNITARYFTTCFSCPDTFDIQNVAQVVEDKASEGMVGQQNMEEMMAAYMNGGMMPGGGNPEDLGSGLKFTFTKMQSDLWQALAKTHFIHHREFMNFVFQEINEDPDVKHEFFQTLFEKMHLELKNIKSETFNRAEQNLELIKTLLDFEGAP